MSLRDTETTQRIGFFEGINFSSTLSSSFETHPTAMVARFALLMLENIEEPLLAKFSILQIVSVYLILGYSLLLVHRTLP